MGEFTGKVAIVTGAASGIGRAIALAFASAGAHTVIADVNKAQGLETQDIIASHGGSSAFIETDVSSAVEVERMVAFALGKFGRLDFASNNAGISHPKKPMAEFTEEEWDRVMNINLKGVWLCMKHEIPHLLKQPFPAIVNTASVAGIQGSAAISIYSASKHGVIGLTKSSALDYARTGLRINAVCPGMTRTPILDKRPELVNNAASIVPMGRMAEPEEIASAVLWLCSRNASYMTGHALVLDGGLSVP